MPVVEVNGEEFEFPDDMPPDQIQGVMQKRFPQQQPAVPLGQAINEDFSSGDPIKIARTQQRIADQVLGMTKTGLETGKLTQAQKEKMLREAAGVDEIDPLTKFLGGASTGASTGLDTPSVLGLSAADLLLGAVGAGNTRLGKGVEDRLKAYKERHRLMSEQDRQMYGEGDIAGNLGAGVAQAATELPLNLIPGAGAKTAAQAVTRSALAGATIGGGSQYAQERGEGRGRGVAALQGAVSGAITGATTGRFGATGIESIFKKAGPTGVMAVVKEGLKDAGMEFGEEFTDQLQQDLVERITKNPDKPFWDSFKETMMAGGVGAILGGGIGTAKVAGETASAGIENRSLRKKEKSAFDAAESIADREVASREIPDLKDARGTLPVDLEAFNRANAQPGVGPEETAAGPGEVESVALDPATGSPIPSSAQVTLNKAQQRLADIAAQKESPVKAVEKVESKISPEVVKFEQDFNDPSVRQDNRHTIKTGMSVRSIDDLDSMLSLLIKARSNPDLELTQQLPREVIEQAVDIGSASSDLNLPELPEFKGQPRPLNWKKNPEVEAWLRKNEKILWPNKSFDEISGNVEEESFEDFKKKEDARKAALASADQGTGDVIFEVKPEGKKWIITRNGEPTGGSFNEKEMADFTASAMNRGVAEKKASTVPGTGTLSAPSLEVPAAPVKRTKKEKPPKGKTPFQVATEAKSELIDLMHQWGEKLGFFTDLTRYSVGVSKRDSHDRYWDPGKKEGQAVSKAAHEALFKRVGMDPFATKSDPQNFAKALPGLKKLIAEYQEKNPPPVDTAFDAEESEDEKQKRINAEFEASEEGGVDDDNIPFRMEQQQREQDEFDRAAEGDDDALNDLDARMRAAYEADADELEMRGRDPNQIFTPAAFAKMFNEAYAARDFEKIVNAVKATSDVSVYKGFLRDLNKNQGASKDAANRMEWMRSVFNGTTPKDAIKATATPPPRPQQPPPPRTPPKTPPKNGPAPPPPSPPGPTPQRIEVDPIKGGGGKSPYKILEDFSKAIGKSLRILRMKRGGLGFYNPSNTTTAQRFASDLDTAAHELAGHWADDKYGIGKDWVKPRSISPYDQELSQFWIFGSGNNRSPKWYRRAEGIAEYIRAYVMNPDAARTAAPNFTAYFEKTVGDKALKDIKSFSNDVRKWAGEDPLIQSGLSIRMAPPTFRERLWNTIQGRGYGFENSIADKLRIMFDDPYHSAVQAEKGLRALKGDKLPPSQQFELMARLLSTHDSRMSDQFERGLVSLRPKQFTNRQGKQDVQRIIDPVTGKPLTLEWLVGTFDTADMEKFNADMRQVSAYMVNQRVLEKAKQLGRESGISGFGAGIKTDVKAAQDMIDAVNADPALKAKLDEGARRFRLWADNNIQMAADAGRISSTQLRQIRKNNQYYVDMHRLSSEFDQANLQQRGGRNLTAKDRIKRFKGSALQIDNVYSNLLEQTDSIQREAHRNVVMNNLVDQLRNFRKMHAPGLIDLDQFGTPARTGDKNTIAVYKDGKKELWKFNDDIHASLKGMGELGTNWLFQKAMVLSRFTRYMITHGPSFILRNIPRDTFERSVNSKSGGKPWDILKGYSQEEISRYEVFGGGQFGNYIVDKHVWDRELKKVAQKLTKDPKNILMSPLRLKHAWEALSEKSEKLGRIAEFRRAFDEGKKKIAADFPNLTPEEVEYEASLYAAGEARGLLDFAKAGTVMRYINQAIPFSNAGVRGIGKTISSFKENPAGYTMKWALHVLLPTMAVMAWNKRDDETWKEYLQLPAYRRDFFWNFKMGDFWLTIPKPHLLGVLSSGVERAIMGIMGEKHTGEDYIDSLTNLLPVSSPAQATGPLKPLIEVGFNYDSFRHKPIIPDWEKNLDLDLRKGTQFASEASKGMAAALRAAGMELDPRSLDFILQGMGGWGGIATGVGRESANPTTQALKSTGLVSETVGPDARDVQWMFNWAKRRNENNNADVKKLKEMRTNVFATKDPSKRAALAKELREQATKLRKEYDK